MNIEQIKQQYAELTELIVPSPVIDLRGNSTNVVGQSELNMKKFKDAAPAMFKMIGELIVELERDKWQLIETAPKDNSEFLGCVAISTTKRGDVIGGDIHICKFNDIENKFIRREGFTFTPTYWQPLPKQPIGE